MSTIVRMPPPSVAAAAEIRVLLLEDSDEDAEMVQRALRAGGLAIVARRVEDEAQFRAELGSFRPDVVLADYRLPSFGGRSALKLMHSEHAEIPVIIVTGALGDRTAVELIRAGASDYILKDRLARLAPAVRRAIEEKSVERLKRDAEQRALETQERLAQMASAIDDVFWLTDTGKSEMLYVSRAYERIWGRPVEELRASPQSWIESIHADDRARVRDAALRLQARGAYDIEYRICRPDGSERWIADKAYPVRDASGQVYRIAGVARDITTAKEQERRIERLARAERIRAAVSSFILRARTRAELFQEACRVAVEEGAFSLAWIGATNGAGELVPVAFHGQEAGRLQAALAGPASGGPLRAVREARAVVEQERGPGAAPASWSASLPLQAGEHVAGCLTLHATGAPLDDAELALLAGLAGDLSHALEYIQKDEELDWLALYDPLTRLPRRELFLRRLQMHVEAAAVAGSPLAVLMLDLEDFKALNDALGHEGGDALLKAAADFVRTRAGGPGQVARISGDRFAVMLEGAAAGSAPLDAAGWRQLAPAFEHGGEEWPAVFRIGIAVYPQDAADGAALLRNAEVALKAGKASSQAVTRYAPAMGAAASRRLTVEARLRTALQRGEFDVHYQPKVDAQGTVVGAEALLRWNSQELGPMGPADFVPVLERTELIHPVGRWIFERAIADRQAWRAAGARPPAVAVNVSAVQLKDPGFVASIRALVAAAGPDPGIDLEVTESVIVDVDSARARLAELRELGLSVALDDFGTGYSSLSVLASLPLATLKIDRSFVAQMTKPGGSPAVVTAIMALARSMALRVVAEGVETPTQLEALRALGCDQFQGFLFSPALPAAGFAALLRSGVRLGGGRTVLAGASRPAPGAPSPT